VAESAGTLRFEMTLKSSAWSGSSSLLDTTGSRKVRSARRIRGDHGMRRPDNVNPFLVRCTADSSGDSVVVLAFVFRKDICFVVFFFYHAPICEVELGKVGVAWEILLDIGQVES